MYWCNAMPLMGAVKAAAVLQPLPWQQPPSFIACFTPAFRVCQQQRAVFVAVYSCVRQSNVQHLVAGPHASLCTWPGYPKHRQQRGGAVRLLDVAGLNHALIHVIKTQRLFFMHMPHSAPRQLPLNLNHPTAHATPLFSSSMAGKQGPLPHQAAPLLLPETLLAYAASIIGRGAG